MLDVAIAIADARSEVATDVAGILSLKSRKRVWHALAAGLDEHIAQAARVKIDALCVRRVMPIWAARFDPDEIEAMLSLADAVVAGSVDANDAAQQRDRFYTDVVDNREYGSDPLPMYVGHAAANTVIEALTLNHVDAMPQADDDEDLDPESYLPCYLAACAAAGGMNDRPASSERRRAFWLWYLDEAVPAAYGID